MKKKIEIQVNQKALDAIDTIASIYAEENKKMGVYRSPEQLKKQLLREGIEHILLEWCNHKNIYEDWLVEYRDTMQNKGYMNVIDLEKYLSKSLKDCR